MDEEVQIEEENEDSLFEPVYSKYLSVYEKKRNHALETCEHPVYKIVCNCCGRIIGTEKHFPFKEVQEDYIIKVEL